MYHLPTVTIRHVRSKVLQERRKPMAILYKANETDFSHFGLGPLNDAVSILVTEERNGIFELTMEYPVSGSQFEELKNDRLIKADAGHNLKDQRFKVIRITKPLKGTVTIYAEHVSYLAQDLALRPRIPFSGNAEQALLSWKDGLVDDNPFIVSSDITTRGNGTWTIDEVENPRRALGGVEGSILDVYGGEYRFDNYQIRLMRQRGVNSATLIAYGRNLVDLTQEEEISNTYTSIYPYSVFTDDDGNQQLVTLPEFYIDSEHVENFARRKILSVDFSTDEIETESALRSAANRYITANSVGVPKVNLKIKYIDLAKTLDYKNQAVLEEVNLCDNVPVYFEKFGINTTAKVIKVVWDDLRGQYNSVEIGEARSSLSQSINATVDGKLEKVEKQINNVQLQADGMKLIYRQVEEPPPGSHVGDLWYQPNGIYEIMYQWDGAIWKEVFNTQDLEVVKRDVDEALEDANTARNQANEAVANADLATQNATQAIEDAQKAFDSAQTAITTADGASDLASTVHDLATALDTTVSGHTTQITDIEGELSRKMTTIDADAKYATQSALTQTSDRFSQKITSVQGDLDDLESDVTSQFSSFNQTVTDITARVGNSEGEIATLQLTSQSFATRIENAEGGISTLTQTAEGLQTRISDAEGNITSVTQLANGMQTRLTNAEGGINTLTQTSTSLQSTISSVRADLDGLEIGGRNLYPNTSEEYVTRTFSGWQQYFHYVAIGGDSPLQHGDRITWSGYLKTGNNPVGLMLDFRNTGGGYTQRQSNFIPANSQGKAVGTTVIPSNVNAVRIALRHNIGNAPSATVQYKELQIEKGNKATDWTPAPEDMATQSQFTQLSDNINARVEIGDVINQINISTEGILISGKKLILDGDTTVTGTFRVANANITSIVADKLIGGTADFAQFNAININASSITSGTIDTNLLTVRGGSAIDYTMIDGSYFESRGRFTRTWLGQTETHDIKFRFQNGYLRARNDSKQHSLYFMDTGISTYADGSGGENASGTLAFRDTTYSTANSVMLHSHYGVVALRSEENRVIMDAQTTANIEARDNSIYLRPYRDSLPGINDFRFWIKDSDSAGSTDGVLSFGNPAIRPGENRSSVALRFKKSTIGDRTIYVTNGTGDYGTGVLDAEAVVGEWRPRASYNYSRAERTRFVQPGTSTTTYSDIQFKDALANSIRTNTDNLYIGSSNGESRFTNNLLWQAGGNTTYRPIRTSKVYETSSEKYKTDIAVFNKNALDIINQSVIYDYYKEGSNQREIGLIIEREMPSCIIDGNAVDGYSMRSLSWKAIQELDEKQDLTREELVLKIAELEDRIHYLEVA